MHEDVCSACYWRNFKKNIDSMNRVISYQKKRIVWWSVPTLALKSPSRMSLLAKTIQKLKVLRLLREIKSLKYV